MGGKVNKYLLRSVVFRWKKKCYTVKVEEFFYFWKNIPSYLFAKYYINILLLFCLQIPSLAGLLFLLKDVLYIQDLNITELELSFVYANKSSLLARIFTALLITPHQRKR